MNSLLYRMIGEADTCRKKTNNNTKNPTFNITKADDDKRLVFGWALVSATSDGKQIIDHQGDIVDQDELEEGAYEYVLNFRDAGEEHIGSLRKKARMVESVVFTEEKLQAMGIPLGTVPYGWWIGFYVDDDNTWEMIKNGTYKMFSIEGRAIREPVNEPLAKSDNEDSGAVAKTFSELMKFNPYHDAKGRFTSGSGGNYASFTYSPGKSKAHDNAIAREKERQASYGGSNSNDSSRENSNKIKQEFLDAGLNSKFKGVQRNAKEGKGAYSYKDATPVSESEALKMNQMHFVERDGKTLVHGILGEEKVFYANNSDSKEIKDLRQKSEEMKQKQLEDMKHRPDSITTTSTYDRWKTNHDKKFSDWYGLGKSDSIDSDIAKSFNEILKFNPYHDRLGRFATGGGFMNSAWNGPADKQARTFSANPNTRAGAMAIARESSLSHETIGRAYGLASTKPAPGNKQPKPQKPKPQKPKAEKPKTEKPKEQPQESNFTPAKTKKAATEYAVKELGFEKASYGSKLDIDTINHINKQVADIQSKYPETKGAVQEVKVSSSGKMYACIETSADGRMTLKLSSKLYGNGLESLEQQYKADCDIGFHPKGTTAKDIVWHEYGHVIGGINEKKAVGVAANETISNFDGSKKIDFILNKRAGKWEQGVYEKATGEKFTPNGARKYGGKISRYAQKNAKELFAEAFAEFNGSSNPSPECIALMKAAGILK